MWYNNTNYNASGAAPYDGRGRRGKLKTKEENMVYRSRGRSRYATPATQSAAKKKLMVAGICAAAVVLVLLYLLIFTNVFRNKPEYPVIDAAEAGAVAANDSGYYYMSGTTLRHVGFDGAEIWSSKFASGALSLSVSNSLICVYDTESANVFDTEKNLLFTIPSSNYRIESVSVSDNCIAMLTRLTSDDTIQYLRIFDATGVELNRIKLESTQILNYGLFGSDDNLWYLTLDATGVAPVSAITTQSPAQKKVMGIVTITDQLIEYVHYFGTDMYAIGTNDISCYDSFGHKTSDSLIYGMDCIDVCKTEDNILFVFAPRSDQTSEYHSTARVLSRSGIDTLVQLPDSITDVLVTTTRLYAISESAIYIYSLEGDYVDVITPEFKIEDVRRMTATSALLVTDSGIRSITLR